MADAAVLPKVVPDSASSDIPRVVPDSLGVSPNASDGEFSVGDFANEIYQSAKGYLLEKEEPGFWQRRIRDIALGLPKTLGALRDMAIATPGVAGETLGRTLQEGDIATSSPLVGPPTVLAKNLIKTILGRFPPEQQPDVILNMAAAATAPVSAPLSAALAVGGPFARNQIAQVIGEEPDTPFGWEMLAGKDAPGSDLDLFLSSLLTFGAGTYGLKGVGHVTNEMQKAVREPLTIATGKLDTFLSPATNLLKAFTSDFNKTTTRQGRPLLEELQRPEVQKVFNVGDTSRGSRLESSFPKVVDNIHSELTSIGNKIDGVISAIGKDTKIKLKDIEFKGITDVISDPNLPEISIRFASDIYKKEYLQFAKRAKAQGLLDQQAIDDLTALTRKATRYEETGLAKNALKPKEKARLLGIDRKIKDQTFSPEDLRQYKTRYDNNGRYDRISSQEGVNQADVYRDLGAAFRDGLKKAISLTGGDLLATYEGLNRTYQTLADLEPLAVTRAKATSGFGSPFQETGQFMSQLDPGSGVQTGFWGGLLDKVYPERNTPEVQFRLGQPDKFSRPPRWITKVANKVLRGADKSLTPFMALSKEEAMAPRSPLAIAPGMAAMEAYDKNRPTPTPGVSPLALGISNPFAIAQANAQEMPTMTPNAEDIGLPPGFLEGTELRSQELNIPSPVSPEALGAPPGQDLSVLGGMLPPGPESPPLGQAPLSALDSAGMAPAAMEPEPVKPMPRTTEEFFSLDAKDMPMELLSDPELQTQLLEAQNGTSADRRSALWAVMQKMPDRFEVAPKGPLKGYKSLVDDRLMDPEEEAKYREDMLEAFSRSESDYDRIVKKAKYLSALNSDGTILEVREPLPRMAVKKLPKYSPENTEPESKPKSREESISSTFKRNVQAEKKVAYAY